MSYDRAIPRSLVKPDGTTVQQALFSALTTANGAPAAASIGLQTGNRRNLHLFADETAGGTVTLRVWGRNRGGPWGVLYVFNATTGVAVACTVPVPASAKLWTVINIAAVDELYVEALSFAASASISAWGYTNDGTI